MTKKSAFSSFFVNSAGKREVISTFCVKATLNSERLYLYMTFFTLPLRSVLTLIPLVGADTSYPLTE